MRNHTATKSRVVQFLAENMRVNVPPKKAARLELALNAEDKIEKQKAYLETERLLKKLIMTRADPINLIAIKLHADIFKPAECPESNPFLTLDGLTPGYDFHRTDAPEVFREAMLEISKKNINYFITTYTKAVRPSEIQAASTPPCYETASRKLRFISENISRAQGNNNLKALCDAVSTLLHRTPAAYELIMLSIIDLHYKITADIYEKKRIRGVMSDWQDLLSWEAKNLKKHAKKPKEFFEIAEDVLAEKLGFKSRNMGKLTSVKDIAETLDYYYSYKVASHERAEIIDKIEKKWRSQRNKTQPSTSKSKPKSCFIVNDQCYELLTNKSISDSQSAAITKVIEHLGKNIKTALAEAQARTDTLNKTKPEDKRKIVVHTSGVPIKKIDSLRNKSKPKLSRSKLLEIAVYYYTKAENSSTEDNSHKQSSKADQALEANKTQDLTMGLGNTHEVTDVEQQTEHLHTTEQNKASQEALEANKTALNTTQSPVNSNEITDSEQQEKQQPSTDAEHFTETNQRIENKQSISNDELPTAPEKSPQTAPDKSSLQEQYVPPPKLEKPDLSEETRERIHEAMKNMF